MHRKRFLYRCHGNSQHSSSPLLPQFTQRDWRLWTIGKAPAPADGPLRLSRAPSAASKLGRSHADIPMGGLACCARPSFPFPHFLFEELFDVRHRPEQLHWLVGKRKKAFTLVEAARIFILSIYDHCEGRDLAPDGPKEGIRQQKPAIALALVASVDRKSTEKSRWNDRIARQFPHCLFGQLPEIHCRPRKGVVASDRTVRQHQHERRSHVLAGILTGLNPEIPIKRLHATFERRPVVLSTEDLDPRGFSDVVRHPSDVGRLAIATHRVTQTIIDRLRVEQCFYEGLAVADREVQTLMFFDCPTGGLLDAGQHKISHRPALEGCGALNKTFLVSR